MSDTPELPFDVVQMLRQGIRVSQAEFARMVGVSRSTVTGWKKWGLIDVGPDGKVNPAVAARQLSERADPARLRAPLLRQVMESTADAQARAKTLAAKVAELKAELSEERELAEARIKAAICREQDAAAGAVYRFLVALEGRFSEAVAAHAQGMLGEWLDELSAVELYGYDLAEYRAERAADAAAEDDGPDERPNADAG